MADADTPSPPADAEAPAAPPPPPPTVPPPPSFARGAGLRAPPRLTLRVAFLEGLFSLLGISLLAALSAAAERHRLQQLVASFGATAVLVYAAPASPLAQPRNVVVGHMLSALLGVCVSKAFSGRVHWLACGLSVGLAVSAMGLTGTTHPPGGATALIAVMQSQSWLFIAMPIGTGACILVVTAVILNNLMSERRYPLFW